MDTNNPKNNFSHPAVIVTVLILIFVGGYFLLNSKTPAVQENIPNPQQNQIDTLKQELDALKQKELKDTRSLESAQKSNQSLSSIVSEWRNRTAFLVCSGVDMYGQSYAQTATAYIHVHLTSGEVSANTNRHAVLDQYGNPASKCELAIPGDPNSIIFYPSINDLNPDLAIDSARIFLDNTDPFLSSLGKKKVCSVDNVKVNTGDQVIILGYPAIGSATDVTATEGIISGYTYPYYITSAKIDHGNSGGVAVLVKNDCFLGLPTGAVVGSIESLGRILDAGSISK